MMRCGWSVAVPFGGALWCTCPLSWRVTAVAVVLFLTGFPLAVLLLGILAVPSCSFGCFCFLLLQKKTVKKAAPAAAKPKKAAATKAKTPTKKAAAATGPKKVIAKKAKATTKSPKKAKTSK